MLRKKMTQQASSDRVFRALPDDAPAIDEGSTQRRGRIQDPPLDLVIGLDFGTAFTKCVVRAPARPGSPAFVVPLGDTSGSTPFISPSVLHQRSDGAFTLDAAEGCAALDELKAPLIFNRSGRQLNRTHIIAFLALVLRRTRRWMLESERTFIGERRVRWSLNLGLPAASHDCVELETLYREFARIAWLASCNKGPVESGMIETAGRSDSAPDVTIEIIPEVAAAVTAYARSRQRRDGLHLLIDVGAGTLDACVFRLHDDTGDRVSIFQACVEPLGVIAHQRDPSDVHDRAGRALRQLLWTTKTKRDPGAREWTEGLRHFMAGGGRDIPTYRQALPSHKNGLSWRGLKLIEVESQGGMGLRPEVSSDIFRRLVVACGLSYETPNIARIDRPHTIEDAEAPARRSFEYSANRFSSGAMQEDDD